MPTFSSHTAPKSIFDTEDDNQGHTQQTNPSTSTSTPQPQNNTYTSNTKPALDPEVSSVFTQSTIGPSEPLQASSSRFAFLKRNKSTTSQQQQETTLLAHNDADATKQSKKKSRFENPFKPHVQTDEDRAIMERMRERLGSREEAIRRGGAQPAGFRGYGGGQAMGGAWTGGM